MTEPALNSEEAGELTARPPTPTPVRPALGLFVSAGRWGQRTLEHALDVLFPEGCASCKAVVPTPGALFCAVCHAQAGFGAHRRELGGIPALAPFSYSDPIRDAVHRFKFQGNPALARRFGHTIAPRVRELPDWQALHLVPVPAHPLRVVERGYNQAALLAGVVSSQTGLPHLSSLLRRTQLRAQQSQLARDQRTHLSEAAFLVCGSKPPGPVCLVDDVLTTGSTAAACIACLAAAGIPVSGVLTLAQV